MDRDVGMVAFALCELADPVHERERLGKVPEPKLAFERALDLGPAFGNRLPHGG